MKRILVCGGRDYDNAEAVYAILDRLYQWAGYQVVIIQGGARGADALGRQWAERNGLEFVEFKADWAKHGRSAGPIRNRQMLQEGHPDLVVAFPGGKGTLDMVAAAKAAGVKVVTVPLTYAVSQEPESSPKA